jgi:hypothetical protein
VVSLPEANTQLDVTQRDDVDEDMEHEYEDSTSPLPQQQRPRNYEEEFGLRNWSSFVMYAPPSSSSSLPSPLCAIDELQVEEYLFEWK